MNKYIVVGVVVVLILLSIMTAMSMYARWQRDQYFGEVIRVSESELVFRDIRVGERTVRITPTTNIRRGSQEILAPLLVGEKIIVFGKERDGAIEATLIRLVEDGWQPRVQEKR